MWHFLQSFASPIKFVHVSKYIKAEGFGSVWFDALASFWMKIDFLIQSGFFSPLNLEHPCYLYILIHVCILDNGRLEFKMHRKLQLCMVMLTHSKTPLWSFEILFKSSSEPLFRKDSNHNTTLTEEVSTYISQSIIYLLNSKGTWIKSG